VFPTLVFGGDKDKPYSHISAGLPEVAKWMWLVRFLRADGSFHFAHGRDIAQVVCHVIDHPPAPGSDRKVVIGNPALTANEAVAEMTEYLGMRQVFGIPYQRGWPIASSNGSTSKWPPGIGSACNIAISPTKIPSAPIAWD
jgi:nucleoside-diphosphate-sugar epimerase